MEEFGFKIGPKRAKELGIRGPNIDDKVMESVLREFEYRIKVKRVFTGFCAGVLIGFLASQLLVFFFF